MSVLSQLADHWYREGLHSGPGGPRPIENPLPCFEKAFKTLNDAIRQECQTRNCTYLEMLEEIRKSDPNIVDRYFELSDAVDSDVYGRWCDGQLTSDQLDSFYRLVDEWVSITLQMINVGGRNQ